MSLDTIIAFTWFGLGLISMIAMWIADMRNQKFDPNYFNCSEIGLSLMVLLLGYLSFLFGIGIYCYNHQPFTKLIYKIANIGIKKNNPK